MDEVWIAAAGVRFLFTACRKRANFAFGGERCWPRRVLVMRLSLIRIVLVAVLAALGAPSSMAQTRPGFWEISIEAAANAELGSPIAPIILGNALAIAEERDPNGARPILSRLHLMLSYIAQNKFDLFKSVYGMPNLKIDVSTFDLGLKDYIGPLRTFQSSHYTRWQNPLPDDKDKDVLLEGVRYGAQHLAEIEVALRKQVVSEDAMGLADALANLGLVFKNLGELEKAIEKYQEAQTFFVAAREERNALIAAELAFAIGNLPTNVSNSEIPTRSPDPIEDFFVSADEPIVLIIIMKAGSEIVTDAIKNGDLAKAEKFIQLMRSVEALDDKINRVMNCTWTCHPYLVSNHFWRAILNETRMNYARKFKQDSSEDDVHKFFIRADTEYKEALEISLFSEGDASEHFKQIVESYENFLTEAGHEEDEKRFEVTIKTMRGAYIGTGGPEEWLNVLNCPQKSR